MNPRDRFFTTLQTQKWVLYVPERVWAAYKAGLLSRWSVDTWRLRDYEQNLQKTPFESMDPREEHRGPLPEPTLTSPTEWELILSGFNLVGKAIAHKLLAYNNSVYAVRFFPVGIQLIPGKLARRVGSIEEYPSVGAWNAAMDAAEEPIRAPYRRLRREFGLPAFYTGSSKTFYGTLVALKKVYPSEQVRRVRRQLEENLRKDPAEAIRYALERGLVK